MQMTLCMRFSRTKSICCRAVLGAEQQVSYQLRTLQLVQQKNELGAFAKMVPAVEDNRATTYVGNATGAVSRLAPQTRSNEEAHAEPRRSCVL